MNSSQLPDLRPFFRGAISAEEVYNFVQRLSNGLLPASVASAALTVRLQQLLTIVEQHRNHLALMATIHPSGSALIDAFVTQISGVAAKRGNGGGKSQGGSKRERAGNDSSALQKQTQLPGSASEEAVVLNEAELLVSGWAWNIVSLDAAYGETGKCWPFTLSKKMNANRLAHCPCPSKAGHESATSAAHTPLKVHKTLPVFDPFDADQMDLYGRRPTIDEMRQVLRSPFSQRELLSGKGPGVGTGRPNFRQPKTASGSGLRLSPIPPPSRTTD
jgi:hypothetical protein